MTLEIRIIKNADIWFLYLYEEIFTVPHFAVEKFALKFEFEKCRNLFLGICMYNVLVQNSKTVSYFAVEKISKT